MKRRILIDYVDDKQPVKEPHLLIKDLVGLVGASNVTAIEIRERNFGVGLHETQKKLLDLYRKLGVEEFNKMGYRKLGRVIGVEHPQKVKHHVIQLSEKGLLEGDKG